jgi:carbamoyl-phosphate synthase large subunit
MANKKIKVLVTGAGGAGTLGREIIKSFSMIPNEYDIIATNIDSTDLAINDNVKKIKILPANHPKYIDTLLKICKKENIQAIAPGSEPETLIISKNSNLFSESNIVSLTNKYDLVNLCTDKLLFSKFLTSKNITTPKTFSFNDISEKSSFNYPLIIKPRIGSGSRNVFLAQNFEELSFFIKYLIKQKLDPIIQEYISGTDNEYTIGLLYCDGGKLNTSIAMRRNLHSGLSTRSTIELENNDSLIISSGISQGLFDDFSLIRKKAEKIVAILDSDGPINIQCRIKDDELFVFEVNPRFSGTTSARSLVGCNEPDILTQFRINGQIPKKFQYKHGFVLKDFVEKFIPTID